MGDHGDGAVLLRFYPFSDFGYYLMRFRAVGATLISELVSHFIKQAITPI